MHEWHFQGALALSLSFAGKCRGRQTGSEGVAGCQGGAGDTKRPPCPPPPAHPSQLAGDDGVADSDPGRLCGGVVRASGEHQPHQTAVRVRLLLLAAAACDNGSKIYDGHMQEMMFSSESGDNSFSNKKAAMMMVLQRMHDKHLLS